MIPSILYVGTRTADDELLHYLSERTGRAILRVRTLGDLRARNTECFIDTVIVGTTVELTARVLDEIEQLRGLADGTTILGLVRDGMDDRVDIMIQRRMQPCYIAANSAARAARIVAHMIEERTGVYRNVMERMCNELAHGRMVRKGGLVDKRK